MKQDASDRRPHRGASACSWGLTVVLGVLGAVLGAQAYRGQEGRQDLARRHAAVAREADRLREENRALREERRALESDPAYMESLLRRWKRTENGEHLVE